MILSSLFLLSAICSFTQTLIQGLVKDSKTNEALPYCSIAIKGTKKGTITNGEGVFRIPVRLTRDTLMFSYVGFDTQIVPAIKLDHDKIVFLKRKDVVLQEFTVHATNDFLYDILIQSRKKLLKDRTQHIAKVYYGIETQTKEQPIEQVECYYNGYLNGTSVDKLLLKNGRIGLAGLDNRYFLTLNSSTAIINIDLTNTNDHSPSNPFQFNKREMKNKFILGLEYSDDQMHKITFHPRNNQSNCFSGEIWIDKENFSLLKIDLAIENSARHPFLPFPKDSLFNVDMAVSRTYKQEGSDILLDHINFSYHMKYKSNRDSINALIPSIITRDIDTKGVLYFYDYNNPFILPYFEYDADYDDYRKMSIIPYNEVFWNNNNTLLLTEKQKENLGFFAHKGCLINFRDGNYGKDFLRLPKFDTNGFFEFYYSFWSPVKRISLNKRMPLNETFSLEKINQSIQTNLYNLKVQILLDVTQLDDSINCRSYTVFDAKQTFYHLPEEPCTNSFLNIYFDICEIERRKMEKELNSHPYTVLQIDSIYKKTGECISNITRRYLKEVRLGKEEVALRIWNQYVLEKLNIDNLKR